MHIPANVTADSDRARSWTNLRMFDRQCRRLQHPQISHCNQGNQNTQDHGRGSPRL